MPKINPFPWLSSLWFKKSWTVFQTQSVLRLTSTYHEPCFSFFLIFSRSTIKRWKDLFTVWRAAARRWRCKRQTALRCLVSCLPFLNPFVNFFKFCWRTTAALCFVVRTHRRLQLGSSTALWSFKLTFLGAKISPLRLCKYNMFFFLFFFVF